MRKSDSEKKTYFRAETRFSQEEGQWYFDTREGRRGPFPTREAAELELTRYVDTMQFVEEKKGSLPSDIDWSDVAVVDINETPGCFKPEKE